VKKTPDKEVVRLMPACAERLVEYELNDKGLVDLIVPRFSKNWLTNWLVPKNKKPFVLVHLDEVGSKVWLLLGEHKSFGHIAVELAQNAEFISVAEWEERMAKFALMLLRGKLVRLTFE